MNDYHSKIGINQARQMRKRVRVSENKWKWILFEYIFSKFLVYYSQFKISRKTENLTVHHITVLVDFTRKFTCA